MRGSFCACRYYSMSGRYWKLWELASNFYGHSIDCLPRRNEQRLAIASAKGHIGRLRGQDDGAEMLAVGRNDPYPTRSGAIDVARSIDLHAIGITRFFLGAHVDQNLPVSDRTVRLRVKAQNG